MQIDRTSRAGGADRGVAEVFVLASADPAPSEEQRRAACMAMYVDVQALADRISRTIQPIVMSGGRLQDQPEETKQRLRATIESTLAQIGALRSRCADVLPADMLRELDDVERWLKEAEGALAMATDAGWSVDWQRIADGLGAAAQTLVGLAALLLGIGNGGMQYRY